MNAWYFICIIQPKTIISCDVFRFSDLEEPMATRRTQLEDSLKLYQFLRDAEVEAAWIKEHKPQAASSDYGNSFEAVQNLQKKHNVSSQLSGTH